MNDLGRLLRDQKKITEAVEMFQQALEIQRKQFGEESAEVAGTVWDIGHALRDGGKHADAALMFRQSIAIHRKRPADRPLVARRLVDLGWHLKNMGNPTEAEELYRESLAIRRELFAEDSAEVGASLEKLTEVLHAQGRTAEVEAMRRERLQKELSSEVK
jgi:tetratricopeptide (TPR) repeat protein